MAIYHCSCKMISRGSRSAVGAAAYRSGEKLKNEYDGLTHDYTIKKSRVVYSEIMLCENAPKEYQDRATLWNAVEKIEKSANAQLAREYEMSLPVELTREEWIEFSRRFVKDHFTDKGMCADFAIHDKKDGNPHVHIMLTTRPIEKDGTWGAKAKNEYVLDKNGERILQKIDKQNRKIYKRVKIETTEWSSKDFLMTCRESLAKRINAELERKNLPQRVDHRSYKDQGIEKIPTKHIGVSANAMEKRGLESKRGNENREIKKANEEIQTLDNLSRQTQREINYIRDDIKWNGLHERIAALENRLPYRTENMAFLQKAYVNLQKAHEGYAKLKPSETSEGRTVENGLQKIPYFEYHKSKALADISFLQDKIKGYIEALKQKRQEQQTEQHQAKQEQTRHTPTAIEKPQVSFHAESVARQLAELRMRFVRETARSAERTSYQPNPIYRQQAGQIESTVKTMTEQRHTIDRLKAERDKLGVFKMKDKRVLEDKITAFERLYRANEAKLKELGVSDPSKAEQAIKEKRMLAEQEQAKAQAAKLNEGANRRAEEAKTAYLDLAQSVPADQRQEIRSLEKEYLAEQKQDSMGSMTHIKAEIEAHRQLDPALQEQDKSKDRQHERSRWQDREH